MGGGRGDGRDEKENCWRGGEGENTFTLYLTDDQKSPP